MARHAFEGTHKQAPGAASAHRTRHLVRGVHGGRTTSLALAPEHIDDLKRSGLTEEVLGRLQFEAVRPHDIKLPGVRSAYRIKYFTLDGKPNCHERWRLFPPIKAQDGHTQKYYQSAGSDAHVYLPPLVEWQDIARDTSRVIMCIEGEKKSATGCLHGLAMLGLGGLWNWRRKLADGERLVIPTLDLFSGDTVKCSSCRTPIAGAKRD